MFYQSFRRHIRTVYDCVLCPMNHERRFAYDHSQNVEQMVNLNGWLFRKTANAIAAACVPLDLAEATAAHDERLEMELLHRVAHLLPRVTPVHLDHHAQLFVQHGACVQPKRYHYDAACLASNSKRTARTTMDRWRAIRSAPLSAGPRR